MKIPYLFTCLLSLLGSSVFGQSKKEFRAKFETVSSLMVNKNFEQALPIWQELERAQPKNGNVKFGLGLSYLNLPLGETMAIDYLEQASEYLSLDAQPANYKEKNAPVKTILFLGKAYHVDNQFDKALEYFTEYQKVLLPSNKQELTEVERCIELTSNAIQLREKPVNIDVVALDGLNSSFPEYRPVINGDETMIMFTAKRPNIELNPGIGLDGELFEDIFISKKENGRWLEPEKASGKINSQDHEACLYLSPDGNNMYMYKNGSEHGLGGGVYESFYEDGSWTEPVPLSSEVNSPYWETDASRSLTGNTIVFTSDRPSGFGKRDLWIIRRLTDGTWAKAENMGGVVNTMYDEESPYLHPDGRTLYFSSKGHSSMGGYDIFVSELDSNGVWSEPRNMGYPLNTTGDDLFFVPTLDGKRAYFSSQRKDGQGDQDLYMVYMPDEREKDLTVYKGKLRDSTGKPLREAVVSVFDSETGELFGEYRANQNSGDFLFVLKPNKNYDIEYEVGGVVIQDSWNLDNSPNGFSESDRVVYKEGDKVQVVSGKELAELTAKFEIAKRRGQTENNQVGRLDISGDKIGIEMSEEKSREIQLAKLEDSKTGSEIKSSSESSKQSKPKEGSLNNTTTAETSASVSFNTVKFLYGKTHMLNEAKRIVQSVVDFLKQNQNAKVLLEGHSDPRGNESFNRILSLQRAITVKSMLNKQGIPSSRIITKGHGSSRPRVANKNPDGSDNEIGRQINRRVEFTVVR